MHVSTQSESTKRSSRPRSALSRALKALRVVLFATVPEDRNVHVAAAPIAKRPIEVACANEPVDLMLVDLRLSARGRAVRGAVWQRTVVSAMKPRGTARIYSSSVVFNFESDALSVSSASMAARTLRSDTVSKMA